MVTLPYMLLAISVVSPLLTGIIVGTLPVMGKIPSGGMCVLIGLPIGIGAALIGFVGVQAIIRWSVNQHPGLGLLFATLWIFLADALANVATLILIHRFIA